jgi:hypothetical protein
MWCAAHVCGGCARECGARSFRNNAPLSPRDGCSKKERNRARKLELKLEAEAQVARDEMAKKRALVAAKAKRLNDSSAAMTTEEWREHATVVGLAVLGLASDDEALKAPRDALFATAAPIVEVRAALSLCARMVSHVARALCVA